MEAGFRRYKNGARQQSQAGEGMDQERAWSPQSSDAMSSQIKGQTRGIQRRINEKRRQRGQEGMKVLGGQHEDGATHGGGEKSPPPESQTKHEL